MDFETSLAVLGIVAGSAGVLAFLTRRLADGLGIGLRPIRAYEALGRLAGQAVESGRPIHLALGRGALAGRANPASLAALGTLDRLAADGCASDVPPFVTVGEASLLIASQDSIRGAYLEAGRPGDFSTTAARFIASQEFPMAYAAGASEIISQGEAGSNLMMGSFGSEVAIFTEAASRQNVVQIAGSDDPVALALAAPAVDELLIGEELFAAASYLQREPVQLASLQMQDILRLLAIVGIILAAIFNLAVS